MKYSQEQYDALLAVCNCYKNDYDAAFERLKAQQREIDALKEKYEELHNKIWDAQDDLERYYDEMQNKIKQAKIEAVKEFAKKLDEICMSRTKKDYDTIKGFTCFSEGRIGVKDIAKLLKEYEVEE
ncbi:MAG: nucleotide exchange factor GrpE [Eubacteriales bacterium]|nr:nucleotide exchange factor GrpE [Eubacteriales bacterium]